MILTADQAAFDELYPFSFTTDGEGRILAIGRSLGKLYPSLRVGSIFQDSFKIIQPNVKDPRGLPLSLLGDLLIVEAVAHQGLKFRGHVVSADSTASSFIFALKPLISELSDISQLGLTIADFELSDPIFDFLMYMQGQIVNQQKLRQTKQLLEWENRVSKLLLSIALATEGSESEQDIYRTTLSAICSGFGWEFGHVFVVAKHDTTTFTSSGITENRAPELFGEFERVSRGLTLSTNEELPAQVWRCHDVVWVKDVRELLVFARRSAAPGIPSVTGVGLPIFVNNEIIAIFEFFTARTISDSENIRRSFKLLSVHIGGVIARQRAERAARQHLAGLAHASKLATLGEMAAGVAHEINNPLHNLSLVSHLLKRLVDSSALTPDLLKAQLDKIDSSLARMASIVGTLKGFSRDSSKDPFQAFSLRRLIQETIELSSASVAGHAAQVSVSNVPDAWMAECRPSQISQVLLNLINNAYDATLELNDRWIRVDVRDAGEFYEIAVTDSGPGIPADVAAQLMTPFFTTKPPGKGTGLGLSISKNIMTEHGGDLSLDQRASHTRFSITLPKHQAPKHPCQLEPLPVSPPPPQRRTGGPDDSSHPL